MCEVDLSLNFRVIPEEVVKFVYNLGAHRLDELMHSLTSEGVRGLVNTVSYDKVHDLREEFADDMKKNLNKRLSAYGVEIVNVNIMAVRLPYSLGATLEGTTAFKTQMGQQHLSHKHNKQLTLNEASVTMTQIKEQNERSIQHVRHSKEVAFLDRERAKVVAQSNFAVAKVLAEKDAAVNIKRAEVGYSLAAIHGEKNAIELRRRVEAECKAKNKMVSQEVKTNLVESRTKLACKEAQSEEIKVRADAEATSFEHLAARREHEANVTELYNKATMMGRVTTCVDGKLANDILKAVAESLPAEEEINEFDKI
eukprot:TRINITY_DN2394_c0_g1_i3.p1 TRINITY_DN2394_c0_g1~~TRINITY_DN2394_c0_g1_i3.p1  ORF type:complete len:311 (+),score=108.69 TRINITY_DN2394_c0_g1_i3:829-1761(+)